MKILMVHDIGAKCGGAEAVIMRTKKELERRGHEVRLLTGDLPAPLPEYSDYSFRSADSSRLGKLLFHLYNPWAKKAAKRAIRDFHPDIVHLHIVTSFSPAGIRACLGIPTFMTIHYLGLFYPRLYRAVPREVYCGKENKACCVKHAGVIRYNFELLRTHLQIRNFKKLSALIVPSGYVQDIVERLGYGHAVKLTCPIDLSGPVVRSNRKIEKSILFAGRLEAEKEPARLLESFQIVREKFSEAKLFFAGAGSLEGFLRSLVEKKGLQDSVVFLGLLDKAGLASWYQKIKIVAVPSVLPEPFPLAGPEAMSFGVPVVASGAGGISEWLKDGWNGLIADPANPTEFAEATIRLFEDKTMYERLAENAKQTARKFSTETHVTRLEELYRKALSGSRPPSFPEE